MNTFTHKVTYTDGSEVLVEDWAFLPILQIHAERELGKPIIPMLVEGFAEPGYFGVWWTLHNSGRTPFGYEKWLGFVEDMELVAGPSTEPVDEDPKSVASETGETESS